MVGRLGDAAPGDADTFKRLTFQKCASSGDGRPRAGGLCPGAPTAACNAVHDASARLCRWMLRARNLSGSDTLPFSQELLAEMLRVQRTTVSPVARTLQAAGMIQYRRGKIKILDVRA